MSLPNTTPSTTTTAHSRVSGLIEAKRKAGNPHTPLTVPSQGAPRDPARWTPGEPPLGARGARYSQQRLFHQGMARAAGRQGQADRGPGGPAVCPRLPHRWMETGGRPQAPPLTRAPPGGHLARHRGRSLLASLREATPTPDYHPHRGSLLQSKHTQNKLKHTHRKPARSPQPEAPKPHCRCIPEPPLSLIHTICLPVVDTKPTLPNRGLGCDRHPCMGWFGGSVQSLSRVRLFTTPWTTERQASLCITNSQNLPKLMSIESVMPSNHLFLYCPLLFLPSIFPSIRVFKNESALRTRWPKDWSLAAASVLPMNTQD